MTNRRTDWADTKTEIAYYILLKRKKELEEELQAIEIALSCFNTGDGETKAKPTLTEDEKVILRNTSYTFNTIKRNNFGWLELYDICVDEWKECQFKDELFQFIKNGEEYSIKELLENANS